ncbi:MAG: HD domain-containing protein [Candidatus Helarchaeota archaeon]|nr:HD domain-containing protein [Candidatus Helarchaeota archaeon]
MIQKVICDPIHHHIYIDQSKEKLILDLINSREVQRLRRIHQLGISYLTYPGAEHSRFSHALGTYHLIKLALEYIRNNDSIRITEKDRIACLAAGILHDVGHSPFSHVLEKELEKSHENWTEELITSNDSEINFILKRHDREFPNLINQILFYPTKKLSWLHALISSQIDADRMDYLLRDGYFCGISYGLFDYRWIFHTMRIREIKLGSSMIRQPVWIEKATRAIEDYIFARYSMYWAVYYHAVTRGYEEFIKAILRRVKYLVEKERPITFASNRLEKFIMKGKILYDDYIELDDSIFFAQFNLWTKARDNILKDLCKRFLSRRGLKCIDYRQEKDQITDMRTREKLHDKIKGELRRAKFNPEYYFLESVSAAKAYDFYHFEKEANERTAQNSIIILDKNDSPAEISSRIDMKRLKIIAGESEIKKYYYVPEECRSKINSLLDNI